MRRPAVEYQISQFFANNTLQFDGELCHKFPHSLPFLLPEEAKDDVLVEWETFLYTKTWPGTMFY